MGNKVSPHKCVNCGSERVATPDDIKCVRLDCIKEEPTIPATRTSLQAEFHVCADCGYIMFFSTVKKD